jgi:nicotinamidase-related amidase
MTYSPRDTALVLIECQNDFMSDGGALHDGVKNSMRDTGMLQHTKASLAAARNVSATVTHAPISFAKGYAELGPGPFGILKGVVDHNAFVKGTWVLRSSTT